MTITHLTDHSLRGMMRVETAARYLSDYRPPGSVVTEREKLLLADKLSRGFDEADAAAAVQAETWSAP